MARLYKTLSTCSMCRVRFTVDPTKSPFTSGRYCSACQAKYFPVKPE